MKFHSIGLILFLIGLAAHFLSSHHTEATGEPLSEETPQLTGTAADTDSTAPNGHINQYRLTKFRVLERRTYCEKKTLRSLTKFFLNQNSQPESAAILDSDGEQIFTIKYIYQHGKILSENYFLTNVERAEHVDYITPGRSMMWQLHLRRHPIHAVLHEQQKQQPEKEPEYWLPDLARIKPQSHKIWQQLFKLQLNQLGLNFNASTKDEIQQFLATEKIPKSSPPYIQFKQIDKSTVIRTVYNQELLPRQTISQASFLIDNQGRPRVALFKDATGKTTFQLRYGYNANTGNLSTEALFDKLSPRRSKQGKEIPVLLIFHREGSPSTTKMVELYSKIDSPLEDIAILRDKVDALYLHKHGSPTKELKEWSLLHPK